MEFYLFGGFLGSGKTTLMTSLAKNLVEAENKKVMLIVNDVGDVGIDAKLMEKLHTDVHELFGGCVCGQIGNLANILKGLGSKYVVDVVLMEASGIAQPHRFIDTIHNLLPESSRVKVITLADAIRWFDLMDVLEPLISSQIKAADYILINKSDSVNTYVINDITADIKKLKADVDILPISANKQGDIIKVAEVIKKC
ncbi:GTP-binding protein [Lutispora sp.]|uniref:GTP-binding protein n=1 Tax=Lutispora sp. TaxID=2828727 RepID=UPI003561A69F